MSEDHAPSQEAYQNFGYKDQLARFLGPTLERLAVTHRREFTDPTALVWHAKVQLTHIKDIMRLSGKSGIIVNLNRHDEDKLKLQVIFVEAADVSSAWQKVDEILVIKDELPDKTKEDFKTTFEPPKPREHHAQETAAASSINALDSQV